MEGRSGSNDHLPEVAPSGFSSQHPYEDFEFYERPPAQVPEYQQYAESPALSQSASPQPNSQWASSQQASSQRASSQRASSQQASSQRASSPAVVDNFQIGPDGTARDRPLSPSSTAHYSEANSGGLQSVDEKEGDKEVIRNIAYPVYIAGPHSREVETVRKGRICGLPKMWFFILAALVLVAIIAIAAALGAVFGTKHS
jgi:hypothetical protein